MMKKPSLSGMLYTPCCNLFTTTTQEDRVDTKTTQPTADNEFRILTTYEEIAQLLMSNLDETELKGIATKLPSLAMSASNKTIVLARITAMFKGKKDRQIGQWFSQWLGQVIVILPL